MNLPTKKCSMCEKAMDRTMFGINRSKTDGLQSRCKECVKSAGVAYRAENQQLIKASDAAYRAANKEKIHAADKKYRDGNVEKIKTRHATFAKENPERVKATKAAYSQKHPQKVIAARLAWRKANRKKEIRDALVWKKLNPEKFRVYSQNRRCRESAGRLSTGIQKRLLILQRGKCACCGLPLGNDFHLDHIMPLALGGSNTDDNVQLLRQRCNSQKHAKHPVEFMQSRGFLL